MKKGVAAAWLFTSSSSSRSEQQQASNKTSKQRSCSSNRRRRRRRSNKLQVPRSFASGLRCSPFCIHHKIGRGHRPLALSCSPLFRGVLSFFHFLLPFSAYSWNVLKCLALQLLQGSCKLSRAASIPPRAVAAAAAAAAERRPRVVAVVAADVGLLKEGD